VKRTPKRPRLEWKGLEADKHPIDYFNPVGIRSIILSARELGASTALTTDSHQGFSVNANFCPNAGADPVLTMPLVQGMGFVTGIYKRCAPLIQSHVLFRSVKAESFIGNGSKFRVTLEDGFEWLIYVFPASGNESVNLNMESNNTISGLHNFSGVIQIAKVPGGSAPDNVYDASAGVYPTNGSVSGNTAGNYSFSWKKGGNSVNTLLMFALPHHVASFSGSTTSAVTSIHLQTSTKGIATGVLADQWHMFEKLPTE
jgi:endo-1,3(4)-beta-glucanase